MPSTQTLSMILFEEAQPMMARGEGISHLLYHKALLFLGDKIKKLMINTLIAQHISTGTKPAS